MKSLDQRAWPTRGWLGLALIAAVWPSNWLLPGLRTHLLFFPLWLGYILTIDAWTWRRSGTSLWSRSRRRFAVLFLLSIPVWWLFELFNARVGNWEYLARERFTDLEYALLASLSFSTVIPAVFATTELVGTCGWAARMRARRCLRIGPAGLAGVAAVGALMLALLLAWPRFFFPFLWLGPLLILEPAARTLNRECLIKRLEAGDWRPIATLALGVLICGFFWELWNLYSYPKWIYHIPFLGFLKVFEMPILGYLGYPPFGLSLYSIAHLVLAPPVLTWRR